MTHHLPTLTMEYRVCPKTGDLCTYLLRTILQGKKRRTNLESVPVGDQEAEASAFPVCFPRSFHPITIPPDCCQSSRKFGTFSAEVSAVNHMICLFPIHHFPQKILLPHGCHSQSEPSRQIHLPVVLPQKGNLLTGRVTAGPPGIVR